MAGTRLEYLFDRYIHQNCSDGEKQELMDMIVDPANEDAVRALIDNVIVNTGSEREIPEPTADYILQNILKVDNRVVPITKNRNYTRWLQAAAVVVFLIAGAVYWFADLRQVVNPAVSPVAGASLPVVPGGDHAFLTMSDGSIIPLDSIQNGVLREVDASLIKQDGVLTYSATGLSDGDATAVYNTLSTPRGGQFKVVLPDGSKVWLNASSSLYYPTVFTGKERVVELTGEAYFEVARNMEKPFEVMVGNMRVKVMGTHFNVNAYSDERSIKTSLLEGSVAIAEGKKLNVLKPGQQGILNRMDGQLEIVKADMETVIAWKNGLFQFYKADIKTIMRQISRWYNVEIVYAGKPSDRMFDGKISRSADLSDVLQILELSDVKFSVDGNRILVQ